MRPIKLTISAFGPYASKQVIDFEELKGRNIFVISGKTGAGKTTIFDAISYALYGEASGESRETDSLRSHFADDNTETYVELEFELRGERYIVNRVPKQKKKRVRGDGYTEKTADATLILPDGKVITKVTNVNDKIIEILGITKEQFKQIVMLAQGEFKKLLLAKSDEREGIFRKIFNTYDFEKIQIELKNKAATLSKNRAKSKDKMQTNLENIKGDHDIVIGEYVDFPLVIEKLKDLLERDNNIYKTLNEEGKEVDNKLQVKNQEKAIIETNNNLLKEKEIITKALEELLSKEDEYKNKAKTIIDGKNAKEVKYIEDKLIETTKKLTKREEDYNLSLKNVDSLKLEQEEANKLLQIEESKECDREKLSVEINNLNKLEEKIIELDSLNNKVMHLKQSAENSKLQIINNKKETEELKKSKEEKELQLKDIANLETKKVEIESDIKAKNKTLDEVRELFKVIRSFQNTYIEHNNKAKEYKAFEVEYKKVKENYEKMDDLYKKEQAGILASKLQENEPCPVCGSTNHPNKATIKENLKIPTKEELKVAKENLDKLEKDLPKKFENVIADAGYESEENYMYLSKHNQKSYIKPQNYEKSKNKKFKVDISKRENMIYDEENDYYICAYGNKLVPISSKIKTSKSGYKSNVTIYESENCNECPYKSKCTKAKGNKRLHVSKDFVKKRKTSLENISTEKGKLLRMNRSIQVEGAFGVLKQDYGFRRFLSRGKNNIKTEFALLSFAYNIQKLFNKMSQNRNGILLHEKKIA